MARSLFRPVPVSTPGSRVRFDTDPSTTSPADVTLTGQSSPIGGSTLYADPVDGTIPFVLGPDGVAVLFQKTVGSSGALTGEVYTLTGGAGDNIGSVGDASKPGLILPGAGPAPVAVMGTALQTSHGYSNNAGGSANLNDTSQYVLGTQSVSLTTDGAGTAKTLKKTGFTAVSATGRVPVIWVKMDDQTHLAACQLYLGDTNLANSYKWDLKSSATQKWTTDGVWHRAVLSWGDATVTGSPTRSAITDAQFRIVDDAAAPITVHVNGWALATESTTWPSGVVSLTFDDTYASQYATVRPKLDQYGFSATAYIIQDYVGQAGRMTLSNLQDMQRYCGWEIAGHSTTGDVHAARFTSLGQAGLVREFSAIRSWLSTNGFGGDHVAYPGGEWNEDVLAAADRFFSAGVTVYQRPETLPPSRRSKIRRGGYVTSSTAAATITAAIDQAYTNKEWLVIGMHDVLTTTSQSTDYSIANFNTIVDYLATKGIPVRTVGDVLRTRP